MKQSSPITFVTFGRTGSGKSSLGNKISNQELFKVGHSMISETLEASNKNFRWPLDSSTIIRFIDTPGFADNRPSVSNKELLENILNFLKSLQDGFHIGLFCLEAKSRVDAYDIAELEMIRTLLGPDVFNHIWIVITKVNCLADELQEETSAKIYHELPKILHEHDIRQFSQNRIIFADFDHFEDKFLTPVHRIMQNIQIYQPEISKDLETPEGLAKAMASPMMREMMKKYERMFAEKKAELEKTNEVLAEQVSTSRIIQKQVERRNKEIELYTSKIEDMQTLRQDYLPVPLTNMSHYNEKDSMCDIPMIGPQSIREQNENKIQFSQEMQQPVSHTDIAVLKVPLSKKKKWWHKIPLISHIVSWIQGQ